MKKTILFVIGLMIFYSCYKDKNELSIDETKHMRGINITCADETVLSKSDIKTWKSWNINTVRINFNKDDILNCYTNGPGLNIWNPYLKNKERLKQWLQWFNESDIQVIIALDMLWGDDHYSDSLWTNNGVNTYLQHRIEMCGEMETWGKQFKNVVYIEVWNEPHPHNELYKTYFLPQVLNDMVTQKYPIKFICMAPADWGDIAGFDNWTGLNSEMVVYSTHVYQPWLYTHQQIYSNPADTSGWPGWHKFYSTNEQAVFLDISSVRQYIQRIKDFKARTGSDVIITEFGVLRWAIDNDKYISDLLTVYEENDIQWIFHSMSGWNGWNPTYSALKPQGNATFSGDETNTLKVLKTHWLLNK